MADLSGLSTNFFATPKEGFTTTLASTISSGATTVPLNSVAGYSNGAIATLVIEPTSSTAKQVFTGVVDTAGVQITSVKWTEGTNQTHNAGSTVVDYTTATHMAAMTKGLLISHNQDGTMITNLPLTTPKVTTGIKDANGNTMVGYTATGSAVNNLAMANAATAGNPKLSATGSDSSVTMDIQPKGSSGIVELLDGNGNEVLKMGVATASAVNEVTVTNAATGNGPTISTSGNDSNVDLNFSPKGTGQLKGVLDHLFCPYKVSAYRNSALTITTSGTTVAFDTELFDTGNNHNTGTGTFTAPVAGFYRIDIGVEIAATASVTGLQAVITVNGTGVKRVGRAGNVNATQTGVSGGALIQLAASDAVTVVAQTNGANAGVTTGADRTWWTIQLVSTT